MDREHVVSVALSLTTLPGFVQAALADLSTFVPDNGNMLPVSRAGQATSYSFYSSQVYE